MGCKKINTNFLEVVFRKSGQRQKKNALDYFSGGMQMPNRNVVGDYRYGYQGQFAETDPETGKVAFQLRLYDSRINRWLTTDPAGQYHSPYMSMGNNWVSQIDPDGAKADDWIKNNKTGEVKWFDGTSDEALASAAIHWDLGIGTDATENLTNLGSSFFGTMTDNIFDNSQIQEQQIAYLMDVSNRIDNLSGAKISEFGDNIIFVKLSSFFSVNRESTSVSNSPSMLGVANDLFGLDLLENELRGTHVGSGLKVFNTLTTYLNPQKTSLGASRSLIESTIPKFELN